MIIAEAGVNHNGDFNIAKRLIDTASECGVDAIKFQAFKAEHLVTEEARKAEYQIMNTGSNTSQFKMLKQLELSNESIIQLLEYCKCKHLEFILSPFDLESIELLNSLGLQLLKIPSGEITNYPYLKKISTLNKKVILSTGMATINEVGDAISVLKAGCKELTLLQCTSQYPTPMQDVNLTAMLTMKQTFNLDVGYSDHTLGIEVAIAAVALGACVIEKHFTLDRNMSGPDHKASLEPKELKDLVRCIRNIEQAMGNGIKRPTEVELKNREFVRKSIVSANAIQKGEIFTENNLCTKRPGNGISPMRFKEVLWQTADKDYKKDELISL